MAEEVNELVKQRLEKLYAIKKKGIYPYGGKFDKSSNIKDLVENFAEGKIARTAGRIMNLRSHGKTVFCDLKDQTGKLQIYIGKDFIGEEQFSLFEKVDIGDIIGIEGDLFKTKTGEKTVKVTKFTILSKSLRPLPEKWHGLKDIEIKYRQRYIDLIVNEDVREVFLLRSRVISNIRNFLDSRGYIEVETPIMQSLPGGAAGEPFKTHHNAFDTDLYLRLAPELYLKKLLVGGFDKVYELNKSFRNEGISTRHNPEFTMLEVYTAYADYKDMMELVRELITEVAREVLGKTEFEFNGHKIDLSKWEEVSFAKLMKDIYDIEPEEALNGWIDKLQRKGIDLKGERISRSFVINIIEDLLKPKLSSFPIFVTDLFAELCPLAKTDRENKGLTERFELFIAGMEIANAYSELNDPVEQRERFEKQIADGGRGRRIDEDFVLALEYGMPPAGGLGIGIDRLLMLFANKSSIRDVVLFPLLRPQGQEQE